MGHPDKVWTFMTSSANYARLVELESKQMHEDSDSDYYYSSSDYSSNELMSSGDESEHSLSVSKEESSTIVTLTNSVSALFNRQPNYIDENSKMKYNGWTTLRLFSNDIVESRWFSPTILAIIILNTVLITLQTDTTFDRIAGWHFTFLDNIFLSIYTFEIILKVYVLRCDFFHNNWNNFDFVIVLLSLLQSLVFVFIRSLISFNPNIFRVFRIFRTIRAIRALRVLRTVSFLKNLQIIVSTMLRSIPAWGSISALLFLVLYLFAIIGITEFSHVDPAHWGSIWIAMFTLFQLLTLDDWFEIYDASAHEKPSIIFFLTIFIILETFIFINLFVAVIVNGLAHIQSRTARKAKIQLELDAQKQREGNIGTFDVLDFSKSPSDSSASRSLFANALNLQKSLFPSHDINRQRVNPRLERWLSQTYLLLASLDNFHEDYQNQQKTLDGLVDVIPQYSDHQNTLDVPKSEETAEY